MITILQEWLTALDSLCGEVLPTDASTSNAVGIIIRTTVGSQRTNLPNGCFRNCRTQNKNSSVGASIPLKMMYMANSRYFQKYINFPLYFRNIYKFPPISTKITFFGLISDFCFSLFLTMMHLCIKLLHYWTPLIKFRVFSSERFQVCTC